MNADGLNQFLMALGRVSAQAGVLVFLVLALRWMLGSRFSPRWRSALWLLVVARLLLPISIHSAASIFNWLPRLADYAAPPVKFAQPAASGHDNLLLHMQQKVAQVEIQSTVGAPGESHPEAAANEESRPGQVLEASQHQATMTAPERQTSAASLRGAESPAFPWARALFLSWLSGAVVLAVHVGRGSLRVARRFGKLPPLSDPEVLAVLEECRDQMRVRTQLILVESDHIASPALHGLFHPRLLLPLGFTSAFSRRELRFVFLHELAHLKRRDLLVNWLVALLQIVHWFNPLIWLGFACWRADRELACDALVLETAGADQNQAYGRIILRLLEVYAHRAATPGLVGVLEDKRRLRQRITMIARFVPTRRWSPLAILVVLALAVVGLTDAQGPKVIAKPPTEVAAAAAEAEATQNGNAQSEDNPLAPFRDQANNTAGPPADLRRTSLDLRLTAATNVITSVSKRMANGQADVLEFPIQIENRSAQTIMANIGHEWHGGEWPPTDLGAAVRKSADSSGRWRVSEAYLSGELGTLQPAVTWLPGQSHEFIVRMNWPGTTSQGFGSPLISDKDPGRYTVRVSLVFRVGDHSEFMVSPNMEIEVRARAPESAQTATPVPGKNESSSTNALRSRIVFERTVFKQGEPVEATVLADGASTLAPSSSGGSSPQSSRSQEAPSENPRSAIGGQATNQGVMVAPGTDWGEPLEGVSVRLQPNKPSWGKAEIPAFAIEARNEGTQDCYTTWDARYGELEVDGRSYSWLPFGQRPSALVRFTPGGQGLKCVVTLNAHWLAADNRKPLQISPGKHTVRYVHYWQLRLRPRIGRLVSNPVDIEVLADVEATDPVWGEPAEGISLQVRADKTSWDALETPLVTLSLGNQGEQRSRFTPRRLALKQLEVDDVSYSWNATNADFLYGRLENESLPVLLSREWQTQQGTPLRLAPGAHTVRFAIVLPPFPPSSSTAEPIPVTSNPVSISVTGSAPEFTGNGRSSTNATAAEQATSIPPAPRGAFAQEQQLRSVRRLIAIGLTMSAADEGFPARVPQSPLVKGPIHFPVPSAFGDWSEWSNGLRGRLLFGVPAGAVYLELENSGTDREIYYEVRQFFNPLSRDSLRGDLRDGAGNVLDVSHPGADKGLGPGPWWLLVQRDSTARFRVDLDAFRYLSRSDSLNVGLGFEQGNAWSIPRGMTDDCYLTATLTVIPPKDSQTPSGAPAWSGALKLPPVEIPKW